MKKQVLVTADRGETRVAILEAEGEPAAAESAKKDTGGRRRRGRGRRAPRAPASALRARRVLLLGLAHGGFLGALRAVLVVELLVLAGTLELVVIIVANSSTSCGSPGGGIKYVWYSCSPVEIPSKGASTRAKFCRVRLDPFAKVSSVVSPG